MATHYLEANTDVKAQWVEVPAGNAWECLNEAVRQPTAPSTGTGYISASADSIISSHDFTSFTIGSGEAIVSATLWVYAQTPSTRNVVSVQLRKGASQIATGSVPISSSGWYSFTYTGALTQAELDSLQCLLQAGTGSGTAKIFAAYVQVETDADSYAGAVARLPGILGHWSTATSSLTNRAGSLGALTAGADPGTFGQTSILPGNPTSLSVGDKDSDTSEIGTLADAAALDVTTGLTIGCWFKTDELGANQGLVHRTSSYLIAIVGSAVQLFLVGGGSTDLRSPSHNVIPGELLFIVGTYDGSYGRLYLNGVLVDQEAKTASLANTANPLRVGSQEFGTPVLGFKGALQEPMLANQAASLAEIQNLYAIGVRSQAEFDGAAIYAMPWSRLAFEASPDQSREKAILSNGSDSNCWVTLGPTASVGGGRLLTPRDRYEVPSTYQGEISVISGTYMGGKLIGLQQV